MTHTRARIIVLVAAVCMAFFAFGYYTKASHVTGRIPATVASQNYSAVQSNFRNGYLYRLAQTPAYAAWKQDNPGEYAAIAAQLQNPGGPAAVVTSPFGIQLAAVVSMYGAVYGGAMTLP